MNLEETLRLHEMWLNDIEGGTRANLRGVNLYGANLRGVNLYGANLEGVNLYGANLEGVNLYGVNLEGAILRGAILRGANLRGANLEEADGYYSFVAYDTSKRIVHCFKNKNNWMIKAGCFWGTIEELEEKVKATHNSKVYLANIEILKGL